MTKRKINFKRRLEGEIMSSKLQELKARVNKLEAITASLTELDNLVKSELKYYYKAQHIELRLSFFKDLEKLFAKDLGRNVKTLQIPKPDFYQYEFVTYGGNEKEKPNLGKLLLAIRKQYLKDLKEMKRQAKYLDFVGF